MPHSPLLAEFIEHFDRQAGPILDLASGYGRNGLYLHQQGFPVHFADKSSEALNTLKAEHNITEGQCRSVDFETAKVVLKNNQYQAILVFRYLHRPLIQQIRDAIKPGGFIIYETFTTENRQFGRPKSRCVFVTT